MEVLLVVHNMQSSDCGIPPLLKPKPGDYTSYFENSLGEQWVLHCPKDSDSVTLYGGDIGWAEPRSIPFPPRCDPQGTRPVVDHIRKHLTITLTAEEAEWLMVCMFTLGMRGIQKP